MQKLISCGIVLALASFAPIASAGECPGKTKYTCESGVMVYRFGLTPAQQQARNARQQEQMRRAAQIRADQALLAAQARQNQTAIQTAYERGFESGHAQAQKTVRRAPRRNRYGYGRRYTTSFNSFRRNFQDFSPAFHSAPNRRRR